MLTIQTPVSPITAITIIPVNNKPNPDAKVKAEPVPVEPYVFATFSKEVIRLFENCEFGVFDFKAYRNSGQVGRGFVLRIKIFEPRDELGELDEVSGFAYWLCW